MRQPALFANLFPEETLTRERFSHQQVSPDRARVALEEKYGHLLEETDRFNRQIVSFQANKTEQLHSWIKYREGFSAGLVELLLKEFGLHAGDTVLDPFAGSATTLLVAGMYGVQAAGIELLPHCHLAWEAKSQVYQYDLAELETILERVKTEPPPEVKERFPHLTITHSAFPEEIESELMAYTCWFETWAISPKAKLLCRFLLTSILETVSYTRKDGQYLRWDGRAGKIIEQNEKRIATGKKPIQGIDKGHLPSVRHTFIKLMEQVIRDISSLQKKRHLVGIPPGRQTLIRGNALYKLPEMAGNQFAAVITSPPYANRYDYTRTYALELAYLGVGDEIFALRQSLLSCTVENKSKMEQLSDYYTSIGAAQRFEQIKAIVKNNAALSEIEKALQARNKRGEINNRGVLTMVQQYFSELTFIFAELQRVCRPGAHIAFVNDNVRYAGEVIPVDLLSTDLAVQVGFEPVKVYVLPQRKGNSSQQMGKFGREPLRKSITIWRKP